MKHYIQKKLKNLELPLLAEIPQRNMGNILKIMNDEV